MKKVLVYGWYHQGNIGDDLFIEAYQHLFPQLQFTFTEIITLDKLQDIEAVFFGGGSFLLDRPRIEDDALVFLKTKKIFYMGIGVESVIHPIHLELMRQALLIATRSPDQVERLKQINTRVLSIPDLVYCLEAKAAFNSPTKKSVLFLPNVAVVPHQSEPHWKHAAWNYFKSECCQFLDWLIENDCQLHFFSMCRGNKLNDDWASSELISHMDKRSSRFFLAQQPTSLSGMTALFSKYETIITQRFHGIVLAEMIRAPYIAIHHHDKFKPSSSNSGQFISYYNSSKHTLIQTFQQARMNNDPILPIKNDIFKELVEEVLTLL
jgi:polysaccharide pyruvyl transferase WcaK-like protein